MLLRWFYTAAVTVVFFISKSQAILHLLLWYICIAVIGMDMLSTWQRIIIATVIRCCWWLYVSLLYRSVFCWINYGTLFLRRMSTFGGGGYESLLSWQSCSLGRRMPCWLLNQHLLGYFRLCNSFGIQRLVNIHINYYSIIRYEVTRFCSSRRERERNGSA